jgi:hypothetical protein
MIVGDKYDAIFKSDDSPRLAIGHIIGDIINYVLK